MDNSLLISDFLAKSVNGVIVDVRTPAEFEQGHIPNAVNIPIFDNEERATVGTIYKQVGRDEAVMQGLLFVQKKLVDYVVKAKEVAAGKSLYVHCWRGGMRSASMAWLFNTSGIKAYTLVGGYKAYRHFIRDSFAEIADIVILSGRTGSGKTEILHEISKLGEQVIDLEGIAHHKGSAFGSFGQLPQPTNEQFENNLYTEWQKVDKQKRIWLEDESYHIGKVHVPDPLFEQMRTAKVVVFDMEKNDRINRLMAEYGDFEPNDLKAATDRIRKRLGGQHHKAAMDAIDNGDIRTAIDISLVYYDKAYNYGLSLRNPLLVSRIEATSTHSAVSARQIVDFVENSNTTSAHE